MLSKKAIHRFAVCSSLILHGLGAVLVVLLMLLSHREEKPNLTVIEIAGVMGEPIPDMPLPDEPEESEEQDEPEELPPDEPEESREIEEVGHENSTSEHQVSHEEEACQQREAEEKKRIAAERKRVEELARKKRQEAEKKRKEAEEKKKRLEAEKKRKEAAERRRDRQQDLRNRLNRGKVLDSNRQKNPPRQTPSNSGPGLAERIADANRSGTGGKGTSGTGTGRVTTGDYKALLHDYCQRFWEEERPSRAQLGGKAPIIDIQVTVGSNGRIQRASIQKSSGISAADQCAEQVLRKIRRVSLPPFSEYKISKSSLTFTIRLEVL